MKTLNYIIACGALLSCSLWTSVSLHAQSCQLDQTVVIGLACTSGSEIYFQNPFLECYDAVHLVLENGSFAHWEVNTNDGWLVEKIADNDLLVTHVNGFLPMEKTRALTFWHYRPEGLPDKLIVLYDDQCTAEGCAAEYNLPGCGESCISGTVYRACGEEPFTDQPTLEGFSVEVTDDMGNSVSEYLTSADGTYSICDLPPGNYIVRATNLPGWTPKVPISGEYAMLLLPGTEEFRNFGSCPECTCEDFEVILQPEPGNGDTAYLFLSVAVNNPYCWERYEITIDSGEIVALDFLSENWEGEIINDNEASLIGDHYCGECVPYIKIRSRIAIDFGIKENGIKATVMLIGAGNQPPEPICVDSIIIEHSSKYKQFTCCPDGSIMGPELVINGNFQIMAPPVSDYNYVVTPSTSGEVSIMNQIDAYNANNAWVCGAKGGPLDNYLVVDGSLTPGLAVWKQQVSGFTAGDQYIFCALFNNLVKPALDFSDPIVELILEDDLNPLNTWSSGQLTIPENPDNWEDLSLSWTVPSLPSTSYTLKIISHDINFIGNDFAVDCISLRQCTPAPPDSCCKDLQAFCDDLEAGIVISADSCNITMNLSSLPACYTIEWVDWGQGPEFGPWTSSTFPQPMHTFTGSGTFPISYLAIAYNDSNFICLEKIVMDTITVQCQSCSCGKSGFSLDMSGQTYSLFCYKGAPTPQLNCPAGDIVISGFFGCVDPADQLCDETVVNYTLTGPNGIIGQGVTTNFPTFFYPASQVSFPGMYTLTATTLCPGQTDSCECIATWIMPPCDTCATVPVGLEAWWAMDEVGGETDANEVNGNHPATSFPGPIGLGGPNPVVGKVDVTSTLLGALEFLGPNPGSYLRVGNTPALNFGNGAFSIDAWIKTNMPTQTSPIVDKLANQSTGYSFSIQGTSILAFPTLAIGTTNGIEVFQGPAITVGQWNFVSVVVDPPNVHFYTGGDPGGSSTFSSSSHIMTGASLATNSLPLDIGRNPLNPHWQIVIDELEIFANAVDASEMEDIWAADSLGKCETSTICVCGGFEDMFVRTPQGAMNMAVTCGGAPLTIPCPEPGKGFHLTGVFGCTGGACPPDHQINWSLVHQSSGTTHSGGFQDNDPFFGIHILPTYISQPGLYTLSLTGYCNGDTCVCEVQFIIDCPDLCPCDIQDILAFSANVNQGFAVALANKSCKACFSPLAVSDCETVEWYVGSTSGTPIGTSIGSQTFCYTFPFAGTYTIHMVVTRLKPDGSLCEAFVYTKSITVSCLKSPICTTSVFPNPGFGEGAIGGNMTMGGVAPGWIGEGDHPTVLEGVPESDDAWSILLTGCYFNSDVLSSAEPVCLFKKDQGLLIAMKVRSPGEPIPGADVKVGRKPPGGNNLIIQYGLNLNQQPGHQRLAIIEDLLPLEDDDWYDLYIPYNLQNLASSDSCGDQSDGLPGYLYIWMSNMLSNDQGDGIVRDAVILDRICMDGNLVSVDQSDPTSAYRIWPNPGRGMIQVDLPAPALPGTRIKLVTLTGQIANVQEVIPGATNQTVMVDEISSGMYFVVIERNGMTQAIFRWVCQK